MQKSLTFVQTIKIQTESKHIRTSPIPILFHIFSLKSFSTYLQTNVDPFVLLVYFHLTEQWKVNTEEKEYFLHKPTLFLIIKTFFHFFVTAIIIINVNPLSPSSYVHSVSITLWKQFTAVSSLSIHLKLYFLFFAFTNTKNFHKNASLAFKDSNN